MKKINEITQKKFGHYPEKILQFGEGNFLRAFVDWMADKANRDGIYEGSIVLCQPIPQGLKDLINEQNGIYTLVMRGIENEEAVENAEIITSVSRCINPYENYEELMEIARSPELEVIVSNTTEAGISYASGILATDTPPASFPAKVTAFLYERFKTFNGDKTKGLLFLPVELIDDNGYELKKLVVRYAEEWGLEAEFLKWIDEANEFTSTLVDRIVTGYPRNDIDYFEKKLGYKDDIIVTSELFNLWVIEGDKKWADKFPVHKTDANVIWTDNVNPYKKRKVRILNGAHTSTVLAAYLAGYDTVVEFMADDVFRDFMQSVIYDEIIPTLDLPPEELKAFAAAVAGRFSNPFIQHKLLDIALNSSSKFLARCLPSILEYLENFGKLPEKLVFSLAVFIRFYRGELRDGQLIGFRGSENHENEYQIRDSKEVLDFFAEIWKCADMQMIAEKSLGNTDLWGGKNLNEVPGLTAAVSGYLSRMEKESTSEIASSLT